MVVATKAKTKKWTIPQLVLMKKEEFIALWKTLPAPDFKELNGEYSGYCIDGGDLEIRKQTAERMFSETTYLGYWLGKAYKPTGINKGEGYNHSRRPGGWVHRFLRFGVEVGTSLIDDKPSYMMYYGHFNSPSGKSDLTDELRKLQDGIYLGCGTVKLPDGKRSPPGPFIIAGPIGHWIGVDDEEAERK
jgi:hypothetical protein